MERTRIENSSQPWVQKHLENYEGTTMAPIKIWDSRVILASNEPSSGPLMSCYTHNSPNLKMSTQLSKVCQAWGRNLLLFSEPRSLFCLHENIQYFHPHFSIFSFPRNETLLVLSYQKIHLYHYILHCHVRSESKYLWEYNSLVHVTKYQSKISYWQYAFTYCLLLNPNSARGRASLRLLHSIF